MSRPPLNHDGWIERLLRRLLPPDDLAVLEGALAAPHEPRIAQGGREAAGKTLRRERFSALWRFALARGTGATARLRDPAGRGRASRLRSVQEPAVLLDLVSDLGQAARSLRRRPGFLAIAALTLGIGVGASGAVFAMINQLVLRPVPGITDPDAAFLAFQAPDGRRPGLSGPVAEEIRRSATLMDGVATFDYMGVTVSSGDGRPIDTRAYTVYGDYFDVLGIRAIEGRLLEPAETGPDADPSRAVISERLRDQLFGTGARAVGRRFEAEGHVHTVVGVVGGGFTGTDRFWPIDVWVPRSAFVTLKSFPRERLWSPESKLNQDFVARPRAGVTLAAAEAELSGILAGLAEADPDNAAYLRDLRVSLHPGFIPPT